MQRSILVDLVVAVAVVVATGVPVRALTEGSIPPAEDCRIAPRAWADIKVLIGTPTPYEAETPEMLPKSLPEGSPASVATEAAVWSTIWELLACANKGSPLQRYALFSDRFLHEIGRTADLAEVEDALATPATPPAYEDQAALVAIWDVRELTDGRVGALMAYGETRSDRPEVQTRYAFFVLVGDRWLIDDLMNETELRMMGIDVSVPDYVGTPLAR